VAGEIITFGVTPDYPATAYGYIHAAEPLAVDSEVRRVERFVERRTKSSLARSSSKAFSGTLAISFGHAHPGM
jgi:mannose-1-phosphate guanylyltransferase